MLKKAFGKLFPAPFFDKSDPTCNLLLSMSKLQSLNQLLRDFWVLSEMLILLEQERFSPASIDRK